MGQLLFISYRRATGYELAHLVDAELRARGVRTFIDVSELDPGQFWPQIKSAIHACRAFVLICANGSFDSRPGDDWVLREVGEATAAGRTIIPVFSQEFRRPAVLPPLIAQALENSGVSMDTQFHVAAFDHLSQLVGGRRRSEQRRRTALFVGLALLGLLTALAFGGREITGLTKELSAEREARRAADVRSGQLADSIALLEKTDAEIRRATEERDRLAREQAASLAALERLQAENRRVQAENRRAAEKDAVSWKRAWTDINELRNTIPTQGMDRDDVTKDGKQRRYTDRKWVLNALNRMDLNFDKSLNATRDNLVAKLKLQPRPSTLYTLMFPHPDMDIVVFSGWLDEALLNLRSEIRDGAIAKGVDVRVGGAAK